MKIKGFFVIPLIAILVAMFTLGTVPGTAVNTSADQSIAETTEKLSDTLTFVTTTAEPTSSLEEEVVGFVSNNLGGIIGEASGPAKGITAAMEKVLNSIRDFLYKVLALLEAGGDALGNGNILGNLGGGLLG